LTPRLYAAVSIESIIMSASSIGIQIIMPETGTSPQTPPPQPQSQPANDNAADDTPKPAPPQPGLGKFVDKLV